MKNVTDQKDKVGHFWLSPGFEFVFKRIVVVDVGPQSVWNIIENKHLETWGGGITVIKYKDTPVDIGNQWPFNWIQHGSDEITFSYLHITEKSQNLH